MIGSAGRGFGLRLKRGRGRALVAAAVLAGAVVAPAVAQASVNKIVVTVSNHAPAVGNTFTVTARALTPAGHTDTSFNGPSGWSDKSGQLNIYSPTDFVNGVATTTAAVPVPYHSDLITAHRPDLGLSGTSGSVNVIGPLDHFSFTPQLHQEASGTSFSLKAYARDAAGNLIAGYTGSPSWSDASGSLSPSSPAAFSGGVSTNTSTQVANPYRLDKITVDDAGAGVQSSTHVFNVLGPFDHFTFSTLSTVATNQPFGVVLRAVDSAGNVITSYNGSPSWSDTTTSLNPDSGPATFVNGVSTNKCTTVRSPDSADQIIVDDTGAGVQTTSPAFDVTASQVFNTPGTYSFRLPCAANMTVTAIGAGGGGTTACAGPAGGHGATVTASLSTTAGEQLTSGVGGVGGSVPCSSTSGAGPGAGGTGSGMNGGAGGSATAAAGAAAGAGGGGGSFLSTGTGTPTASSLLLVGGGGGGSADGYGGGNADSAGSPTSSCPIPNDAACGGGAGTSAGTPPDVGTGGVSDGDSANTNGSDGAFLSGGTGGTGGDTTLGAVGGGGGGGGYYGGGGGGGAVDFAGGGGGGLSFIASGTTNPSGPSATSSPAEVSITYSPTS